MYVLSSTTSSELWWVYLQILFLWKYTWQIHLLKNIECNWKYSKMKFEVRNSWKFIKEISLILKTLPIDCYNFISSKFVACRFRGYVTCLSNFVQHSTHASNTSCRELCYSKKWAIIYYEKLLIIVKKISWCKFGGHNIF